MESVWVRRLAAALLLALVGIVGVFVAFHSGPFGVDQAVMNWMVAHRSASSMSVISLISDAFGPLMVAMWTVAIAAVLVMRDRNVGRGAAVLAGVACAGVVTEVLKVLVARPRPPLQYHLATAEMTYSYPSGHVTGTCALALMTAVVATSAASRRVRTIAIAFAVLIGVAAAFTRLYLGVHWFSDVLAAFAVATVAALVVPGLVDAVLVTLRERLPDRLPEWIDTSRPRTATVQSTRVH